jgi:hypothetical protein
MVRLSPVCKKCKKGVFSKPALKAGKMWEPPGAAPKAKFAGI